MVDHDPSLTDVQKLYYLRQSLQGDASKIIQNLELNNSNYAIGWKLIKERFENRTLIAQTHLKGLFGCPKVQRVSAAGLRHLLDSMLNHLYALEALNLPVEHWDQLIIHLFVSKLDEESYKEWQSKLSADTFPTRKKFESFLHERCRSLEAISSRNQEVNRKDNFRTGQTKVRSFQIQKCLATQGVRCKMCNEDHHVFNCDRFVKSTLKERWEFARKNGLCLNCLKPGHRVNDCRGRNCKHCGRRHNTLLHGSQEKEVNPELERKESKVPLVDAMVAQSATTLSAIQPVYKGTEVLLSTAVVDVLDSSGRSQPCRVLLDSGSQSNFMTKAFVKRLGLKTSPVRVPVSGISNSTGINVSQSVRVSCKSRINPFKVTLSFLVLPKITGNLPVTNVEISNWKLPDHIRLADPQFYESGEIDALFGNEIFWKLICVGQLQPSNEQPILQKTVLGWIVSGQVCSHTNQEPVISHLSTMESLEKQLNRFWELENCKPSSPYSGDDQKCEEIYRNTTKRDNVSGRFIVELPLKGDPNLLEGSKDIALRRYNLLEKRLGKNPELNNQYEQFMQEYINLGHMEKVPESDSYNTPVNYIPHHPVFKMDSLTTKLRVVFDASAKTAHGKSLNDLLMPGPSIQESLFSLLVRFRSHRYVLIADLEKMYRQISVSPQYVDLQRIIWRSNNPQEPFSVYRLLTITYGTTCAPYLATRTLKELALQEQLRYPVAAAVMMKDFYVDDLLTGCNTIEEGILLRDQLIDAFKSGGFNLRKWCSNSSALLKDLDDKESDNFTIDLSRELNIKTLGLIWDPRSDILRYSLNMATTKSTVTKRIILASVAKIFDPLGLLGPVILRAKLLLQDLWRLKLGWDEALPTALHSEWITFRNNLHALNSLNIRRFLFDSDNYCNIQCHCFSDASEKAFGAAIYLRSETVEGKIHVSLICSKNRVAPLKVQSLPRLELCGALLATELADAVKASLHNLRLDKMYFWTDSSIVLSWIKSPSTNFKTFVANRISKLQELSNPEDWRHVSTRENPADFVSRGVQPHDLCSLSLWWEGPSWLRESSEGWPHILLELNSEESAAEIKTDIAVLSVFNCQDNQWLFKYSSFAKLIRILSYILRFVHNLRSLEDRLSDGLTVRELRRAKVLVFKFIQQETLGSEIVSLNKGEPLKSTSKILALNPFMDSSGLIRVGGRLAHSNLESNEIHQILLPNHPLVELFIREEHKRNLHAGPQTLLNLLRSEYWPLQGRRLVKKIVHRCIRCFRNKPKLPTPIMSALPRQRVSACRPFLNSGVDYCGPVLIKPSHRRGLRSSKAYIAVFVCMATKAIHLELVGSLTSADFIGALKRFISRRGRCENMYSDNGTNFIGAVNEMKIFRNFLHSREVRSEVQNYFSGQFIQWHFIPPRAPHYGGLWEAGVKSMKHHLRRLGNNSFTFEEYYTLLTQIECILNSRPLSPMSSDPSDLNPLTPSHFIIGEAPSSLLEPDYSTVPTSHLSRWQHLQQLLNGLWRRWNREYLQELQVRSRWKTSSGRQLKKDMLVLVSETALPPCQWKLGRIIEMHPGSDGVVRVVTIKTASGIIKRGVHYLAPLPIHEVVECPPSSIQGGRNVGDIKEKIKLDGNTASPTKSRRANTKGRTDTAVE